jgi:hypothetical protein
MKILRYAALLSAFGYFVAGCGTPERNPDDKQLSHQQGHSVELQCTRATGTYDPESKLIDLHLKLRLRSRSSPRVKIYRLWEAVRVEPLDPRVHVIPLLTTGSKPTSETAEAVSLNQRWTDLAWVIPNWAGIELEDIQRDDISAKVSYRVGETKSNEIIVEIHLKDHQKRNSLRRRASMQTTAALSHAGQARTSGWKL